MKAFNKDGRDSDECPFWPPYDHSLTTISEAQPQTIDGMRLTRWPPKRKPAPCIRMEERILITLMLRMGLGN